MLALALSFAQLAGSNGPIGSLPRTADASATSATIDANERSAVRALRCIFAAERAFQRAAYIDTNCDGIGEYGYLSELAGAQPMRVSVNCHPGAGSSSDVLATPLLPPEFGVDRRGPDFLVAHGGYYFKIWLPTETQSLIYGISEDPHGGKHSAPFPGSVNGSKYWTCYAWPIFPGITGIRAFGINQRGYVLKTRNRESSIFGGSWDEPVAGEILVNLQDMSSPLRVGFAGGTLGEVWNLVP